MHLKTAEDASRLEGEPGVEYVRLVNLLAAGQIALYLTTKLWFPPFEYPQVPLFGMCRHWPDAVNYLAFFGSLAGTFFAKTAADKRSRRIRHGVCAVSFAILFAMNQHRLQPWAYQFFILHAWLALADHRDKLVGWRWLVISIYFYSALSKIDYAFCTNHGPFLWDGLLHVIGVEHGTARWPLNGRFLAAVLLPAAELLTAGCLCFRRTQRAGRFLSLLMHAGLLLALGPWGHNHSAGVLIWNVFFLGQNLLLFPGGIKPQCLGWHALSLSRTWSWRGEPRPSQSVKACHPISLLAWSTLFVPLLAPLGDSFGLWDHWPSWSVYSARPERTRVFIHEDDVDRLPIELQQYVQPPPAPLEPWRQLRIGRWSLDASHVPIYPQSRFHVGVALAVAEQHGLETIRLVIETPPDRWTGRRTQEEYIGFDAARELAATYRVNAMPR